jgi:small-conductance mechanosensitive channel
MQSIDQSGDIAEPAFRLLRLVLVFLIFVGAVAAVRWGVHTFLLKRGGRTARWRNAYLAVSIAVVAVLLLLSGPADRLLTGLGDAIGSRRPQLELGWLSGMMAGLYFAVIATLVLFLAMHVLGSWYWFADQRVHAWQTRLRAAVAAGESDPRFHASRIVRVCIHLLRQLLAAALILAYFYFGFAVFPRTEIFTNAFRKMIGPPLHDAVKALEDYAPNLGYLFVVLVFAWILRKGLKYFFDSIKVGDIVLERFPPDWSEPTYKLCRTVLFLFVLMVSFPYLPGANSAFFRGFSVFVGALVTFGSSGLIGNILAGILLTYTRAFKVGDIVQIEGVYGKVAEKTLLVTRLITAGKQHVAIPNGKVLTNAVTNYSAHGFGPGVAVSITVTIGYEVDWRTVHRLLTEGATRTEQLASEPAPRVMEASFGNYSVEYALRAWTKTSEEIFETYANLRRNVLDAFADGGVEIMTPTILSHRDASELAVPTARYPNRTHLDGIRVSLDPPNPGG